MRTWERKGRFIDDWDTRSDAVTTCNVQSMVFDPARRLLKVHSFVAKINSHVILGAYFPENHRHQYLLRKCKSLEEDLIAYKKGRVVLFLLSIPLYVFK